MKTASGYEIYHNTLSACLDEIESYVTKKGYEIGEYFPLINHIHYGKTERTELELFKNGKEVNTLKIQIYRLDSGRYELNCYPIRKFALGGGADDPEIKVGQVYLNTTNNKEIIISKIEKMSSGEMVEYHINNEQPTYRNTTWDRISLVEHLIDEGAFVLVKNKYVKGGYTRPSYKIITTGFFSFKTKDKEFIVRSGLFERLNDTEDVLEIQDELRGELGMIIIQNSAWKRLSDGKTIKARSSKGNLMGTLTRVAMINDSFQMNKPKEIVPYSVGDKFKYKFDNKTYEVIGIGYNNVRLQNVNGKWFDNREVTLSLMNKWINQKMMVKTMATGGSTQTYKDLSKETPMVVNDSATKMGKIPEIDIIKTGKVVDAPALRGADDSYKVFQNFWNENNIELVEQMNVLFLSKANKPIGIYQHSKGGIDGTILDIEIISAMAVKSLAKAVIIAHNHPSGALRPSDADKQMTKKLSDALDLFQISLLDSLIVTKQGYFSFADEGLMN